MPPDPPRHLVSTCWAIALVAGAVMLFELSLIRIFSFITWHHLAFMVISIALLGFAVSGVLLELWPRAGRPTRERAALYAGLFGVTSLAAVLAVCRIRLDLAAFADDPSQIARLAALYLLLVAPFACAGLAIATLLDGYAARVGQVYGSDLAGAALGCVGAVVLTGRLGVEGMLVAAACLATLGAAVLARPGRATAAWTLAALLLAVLVPTAPAWIRIPPGPGKALERQLRDAEAEGARLAFTRWSALFRTDVIENSNSSVPWTHNPFAAVAEPRQHQIVIDGDAMTSMVRLAGENVDSGGGDLAFLDFMLPSLGFQALAPERVLVIGSGGGVDVLAALHHGARHVDAVEVNPDIARLVREDYADWNDGLFSSEAVTLHVAEGRSFVRRSGERWDLIQLSLVDTWASSAAGAYSLAEGYLYTVEAFEDYLAHLESDGVVSVCRWLRQPPRETLRLVTLAAEALTRRGAELAEAHLVVAANGRVGCLLAKAEPFTLQELTALARVARKRFFSFLLLPGREETNAFVDFVRSNDRAAFLDAYPVDVSPASDDRPFFFQFGRWRSLRNDGLSGKLVLLMVLAQAVVFSLLLLVAPVVRRAGREKLRQAGGTIAYFLAIGVGFMLLEIALMQRFTFYLGHPVYGISVVLAGILLGAGAGSLASPRLVPPGGRADHLFAALILAAAFGALGLPALLQTTLGWALGARIAFAAALLLPIGFLLGIPFPIAMARLAGGSVGWAWAANGCGSVLGPLVAMIVAIDLGYSRVMLFGSLLYAGAYLVFRNHLAARV